MAVVRDFRARLTATDSASKVVVGFGRSLRRIGEIAAGASIAALGTRLIQGIARAAAEMVKFGATFNAKMSAVKAITRATAVEMGALEVKARSLGSTTVFSASEAAEAMENFALAGFSVNEILGAAGPTLNLAAAGVLGMGDAASITSDVMRGMGLEVSELEDVVDLLAKTASSSNQRVADLGAAFAQAAPSAAILGVDIEDLSTALAIMADRAIRNSTAGAALKTTFATFLGSLDEGQAGLKEFNVQIRDTKGQFLGLEQVMRNMADAGITAEDAFEIFGKKAGNAMGVLLRLGPDAFKKTKEGLQDRVAFAAQVAADRLDNLRGDAVRLNSAFGELKITAERELDDVLRTLTQDATDMIVSLAGNVRESEALRLGFIGLATGILQATLAMLTFVTTATTFSSTIIQKLSPFLSELAKLVTWAELAMLGWSDASGEATQSGEGFLGTLADTIRAMIAHLEDLRAAPDLYRDLGRGAEDAGEGVAGLGDQLSRVTVSTKAQINAFDALSAWTEGGGAGLIRVMQQLRDGVLETTREVETVAQTLSREFRNAGVGAADAVGDALLSAATEGGFAWKSFLETLLVDLARVIIKALFLRAILALVSSGGSELTGTGGLAANLFLSNSGGGFSASEGLIVPGTFKGRDSVSVLTSPGEAILPRELTAFLMDAAMGGSGGGGDVVVFEADIPGTFRRFNQATTRRNAILKATSLTTNRARRVAN